MLYRLLAGAIVAFWLLMSFLLVRDVVDPTQSRLLAIPTEHVLRLMFLHGQASDLHILMDGRRIGRLLIQPQRAEAGANTFNLNSHLRLPLGSRDAQRVSATATIDLDEEFVLQHVQLSLQVRESALESHVTVRPPLLQYRVDQRGQLLAHGMVTLDADGAHELLTLLGIDPSLLAHFQQTVQPPEIITRRSELRIRDETVETYLVSVYHGELAVAEMHVSQLGQVLSARIFTGLRFSAEDLLP